MPRKKIKITPPEITEAFLQEAFARYSAWQEEYEGQKTLYHTPAFKEQADKLFDALTATRTAWAALNAKQKHLLISTVMEETHGLRFFCADPMEYSAGWKTDLLDTEKVDKTFEKNIEAALTDYQTYCQDRERYFSGAPPLEPERKLVARWLTRRN